MPERDDLLAALELGEEQDLVDQLAGVLDLRPRLVDQLSDVGAGQVGRVEKGQDPCERRSQLVRDRGRKARAELVEAAVEMRHQIVTIPKPGQNAAPIYRRAVAKILIVEDDNVIADGMARHLVGGRIRPDRRRSRRARAGAPPLRESRRLRPRPDAARARRLEADRDRTGRGDRDADRRRLRARHRARPRARARDRRRRLPREAVLDARARRARRRCRPPRRAATRSGAARRSRSKSCGSTRGRCRRSWTAGAPS